VVIATGPSGTPNIPTGFQHLFSPGVERPRVIHTAELFSAGVPIHEELKTRLQRVTAQLHLPLPLSRCCVPISTIPPVSMISPICTISPTSAEPARKSTNATTTCGIRLSSMNLLVPHFTFAPPQP
jgi:hypothetical protein